MSIKSKIGKRKWDKEIFVVYVAKWVPLTFWASNNCYGTPKRETSNHHYGTEGVY